MNYCEEFNIFRGVLLWQNVQNVTEAAENPAAYAGAAKGKFFAWAAAAAATSNTKTAPKKPANAVTETKCIFRSAVRNATTANPVRTAAAPAKSDFLRKNEQFFRTLFTTFYLQKKQDISCFFCLKLIPSTGKSIPRLSYPFPGGTDGPCPFFHRLFPNRLSACLKILTG